MDIVSTYSELPIPEYALSYLINDDPSALEDGEIKMVDEYIKGFEIKEGQYMTVNIDSENEAYFTNSPEFGLPCNVVDCEILICE